MILFTNVVTSGVMSGSPRVYQRVCTKQRTGRGVYEKGTGYEGDLSL